MKNKKRPAGLPRAKVCAPGVLVFPLDLPVFKSRVTVIVGDYRDMLVYTNRKHRLHADLRDEPGLSGQSFTMLDEGGRILEDYLWMEFWHYTTDNIVTLSHELTHYVTKVLKRCGIPIGDGPESEVLAYTHDFLFKQALHILRCDVDHNKGFNVSKEKRSK